MKEHKDYLTKQLVTYLGNKRALLEFIGKGVRKVKQELRQDKLAVCDLFSGTGVVARYLKAHASWLGVNDLELYSDITNRCYLSNEENIDFAELKRQFDWLNRELAKGFTPGFISELYAPKDDNNIQKGERVFYTTRNANFIDTARQLIGQMPQEVQPFFLGPLLSEASIRSNTSGVFKGFYKNSQTGLGQFGGDGKNALKRITSDIVLELPVFSRFSCPYEVYRQDAALLAKQLPPTDLVYIDPPYNQHPYGSNYFMLNLICKYERPKEISPISGIPTDWNRSDYNKERKAIEALAALCSDLNSKYLLISFNSDGFIKKKEMEALLQQIGKVKVFEQKYNTFRGSRNLNGRDIHIKEYLYLVRKG